MKKKQAAAKHSPVKIILFVLLLALCLFSAGSFFYKFYEPEKRSADLQRLTRENYQGIFLSMYAPEAFPEDIYPTYMGYDAVSCSHRIISFSDLSEYLTTAFSSGNEVSHVFLVLDPLVLWNSCLHNNTRFQSSLQKDLLTYINAFPETEFTIFFSSPSLEYWQSHADTKLDTYCDLVQILANSLIVSGNTSLHFTGGEEWLIANPAAYDTPSDLNAEAARSTMLLVLSGALRFENTESTSTLEQFRTLIETSVAAPASYPDLSDYDIVFFGDSVFGNYHDFASIPGVIGALTGADCHNYAIGGSTATLTDAEDNSFIHAVQGFLADGADSLSDSKKLRFVINYGLNDYFVGYPTEDYCEGLRNGIQALQDAYPDAEFLIVSSNYILSFEKGTAVNGDSGEILADYIAAAEETAAAMSVDFLNVNDVLQWDAENAADYLADSIHPNEEGRFLYGVAVIRALETSAYPAH